MSVPNVDYSLGLHYAEAPQLQPQSGEKSWVIRSANVVVVISQVSAGVRLERSDQTDEYMLLVPPDMRTRVSCDAQTLEAGPESLTIVPPGTSVVEALQDGTVTRVFSVRATDLVTLASNSDAYANGAPSVTPLVDWPMPTEGYRLRHYRLTDYNDPKIFGRLFRSRNLMINVFQPVNERRDPRKLSPHSHADFEQLSLALSGSFIHHLRTPWGPDSAKWKADEHVEVHSPSTLVIPTDLIHTTQATGSGVNWLIDVFGPPRMDFSLQPGVVRNAAEYPMPQTLS
jgi:mannose-6-phosphate isomerase-like protein (cupin superfamily)